MIKILAAVPDEKLLTLLESALRNNPRAALIGTASDPYEARDRIQESAPDVLIMFAEMPRMDGITFLKRLLPQFSLPVIVLSGDPGRQAEALDAGAVIFKSVPNLQRELRQLADELVYDAVYAYTNFRSNSWPSVCDIIALGASTGGTDALEIVLKALPNDVPPVIVTQHMPPVFTKMYADRLNKSTSLNVTEAVDGTRLTRGMCIIAEGGKHLELHKDMQGYYITSKAGEKTSGHCPSVDVMFRSAAKAAGGKVVAALLTGMGADGAKGLLELKEAGAYTIGQDKESCIVYGMPMEAYKLGAVCKQAPLKDIGAMIAEKSRIIH